MVTEPLQGQGQDEQLVLETARFAREGIRFESWSIHGITQRMRPWPDIVARAFGHARGLLGAEHSAAARSSRT